MKYIVDRCESASDVKELEAEFFDDLTEMVYCSTVKRIIMIKRIMS